MIYFTSDTHFGHDKEFVWKVRGFNSVEEMNEAIIERWNAVVQQDDEVYHLGDIMLGNSVESFEYVKRLNGKIHILYGNHDTNNRLSLYASLPNVCMHGHAITFKYCKQHFYLSHYPTITSNMEKSNSIREHIINLYGHTHQTNNFYNDIPFMYHVGMDSHNCTPVSIEQILEDIQNKIKECEEIL